MSKLEDLFFNIEEWAKEDYFNGWEKSKKEFIEAYMETFKDYCEQTNFHYNDEDLELAKEDAIDAYENVYSPTIYRALENDEEYNSRHHSSKWVRTWLED